MLRYSILGWLCFAAVCLMTAMIRGEDPGIKREEERLRKTLSKEAFEAYLKKRKGREPPAQLTPDEEALIEAADRGDLAAVTALLAKGVKTTIRAKNGETPLGKASASAHYDIADLLMSKGATVNDVDRFGTPLWWAAKRGDVKRVEELLGRGADINKVPPAKVLPPSPLEIAALNGRIEVAKLLVAKGATPDEYSCALLGDANTLAMLLREDPARGKSATEIGARGGISPLHLAMEGGHTKVVELLLAAGADMWLESPDRKIPIEMCTSLEMLKLYLAKDPDLLKTERGSKLLTKFQNSDRQELASHMLEQGGLPLWPAKVLGELDLEKDRQMVDLLIKTGATKHDLKGAPYGGPTALDFAIYSMTDTSTENPFGIEDGEITVKRNPTMALWLIEQGIPLNLIYGTRDPSCTLNRAIEHNELEILKVLIDKGVNLTPQWHTYVAAGQTMKDPTYVKPPLVVAARSKMEVVKLLVERGVNVNDADPKTGWTPLHTAALDDRRELADFLLSKGANPRATTVDRFNRKGEKIPGDTPAKIAAEYRHPEMAAYLKSKE